MTLTVFAKLGILTILSFPLIEGENILFLGLPFFGHLNPMVKTANELSSLGHNSYILMSERYRTHFYPLKEGVNFVMVEDYPEWNVLNETSIKFFSLRGDVLSAVTLFQTIDKMCDRYLLNEELFERLKSLNASLAIVDGNFIPLCLTIFAYKLDIPFLFFGLHIQIGWFRTPWSPAAFPIKLFPLSDRMSFPQRLMNFLLITAEYLYPLGIPSRSVKEYVPERPAIDFADLIKQCELFIIDTDSYLDFPLSALPNVKYIGGLSTKPAEPLHGDILEFVNASKHGIIVVSPGSTVSWHVDHVNKMAEAFTKIKYDVVWKHSNASYSRQNVFLTKWLPQNDLLGHPNTKLFITHCGNSGQYESLYHAIPMIGFPVFADQFFNGNRIQVKGYGKTMDIYKYTVHELIKNIEEVIENPKYKKTITRTSQIFHSQRERPAEKAARHIDEIIKYGGSHLKSACQDIPLYQFLMLDILAVILAAIFIFLYLTVFILRKCCRFVCRRRNKTKVE